LIPKCSFKLRYSWFHSGEAFSIMFHRQHKDIIVLAQRTGIKFSNKHISPYFAPLPHSYYWQQRSSGNISGSIAREAFICTQPLILSLRLVRLQ